LVEFEDNSLNLKDAPVEKCSTIDEHHRSHAPNNNRSNSKTLPEESTK
jgi:hypothetical protein